MEVLDTVFFKEELFKIFEINKISCLLDDEKADKLAELTRIMLEENKKYNLTAITDIEKIITLHYADSLISTSLFSSGAKIIDVGCGAGFPSLPLAICRPDLKITAMDSTSKKVNYVSLVSDRLSLNVETICARAEEIAKAEKLDSLRESFDYSTARAVADLTVLCELCMPLVRVGGSFVVMKGKNGKDELQRAKNGISTLGGRILSVNELLLVNSKGETFERVFAEIKKEKKTPLQYPRSYSQIAKKPL